MDVNINKHVFHGIYSNFGYKPKLINDDGSIERLFSNYPIHFFRASFAEKENPDSLDLPKEFKTEEEVLKWYKKNKYSESEYNKLNFPDDICKNYFIIPESEFHKYKDIFNRMIKGVKFTSNIEIESKGTAITSSCPKCKKVYGYEDFNDNGSCPTSTAGPITFNSPNGKPSYFTADGYADDIGYLNGQQITNSSNYAGPFEQDLIPKTKETTLSFKGVNNPETCGPYSIEATVTWFTPIEYTQKLSYNINYDSTKVHALKETEKRLSANDLHYQININLDDEEYKNKERLSVQGKEIFKNEWEFDREKFVSLFQEIPEKFNYNATFINDPVIMPSTNDNIGYMLSATNMFSFEGSIETVDTQKNFTKEFTKLGSSKCTVENDNSIIAIGNYFFIFYISAIFYIKEQKKFLCFIEINSSISLDGFAIDKETECDTTCEETDLNSSSSSSTSGEGNCNATGGHGGGSGLEMLNVMTSDTKHGILEKYFKILGPNIESVDNFVENSIEIQNFNENIEKIGVLATDTYKNIGSTNPLGIQGILTTDDSINIYPPKYKTSECGEEIELEFQKSKSQIKISEMSLEIEIFQLKDTEFTYDNSECENIDPIYNKDIKNTLSIKNIKSVFEILPWEDTDFSSENKFPDKIT